MGERHSVSNRPDYPQGFKQDAKTAGCGFLMGVADIIPGVSGGTVALILGIYRRLISAVSRSDSRLLGMILSRRWREACDYWDFRFLVALATGILTGIACLSSLMTWLLTNYRSLTYASFAGLILASVLLVGQRVGKWTMQTAGLTALGAVVALRLVTLQAMKSPPDSLLYLFVCGCIGITAMILPGISGAFILLLLQRYFYVVEKLKELLHGNLSTDTIVPIIVFCSGCVLGLLIFSRFLRWLLLHYERQTMATLCGFMLGAMYCLWPFQLDTTPEIAEMKRKVFAHHLPERWTGEVFLVILAFLLSTAGVLIVDTISRRFREFR